MSTENFLEITIKSTGRLAAIAKTSIAAIEDTGIGCIVTLKEKRKDGTQISFEVQKSYVELKIELNRWEKENP